ncbi:MAG: tRNA pseudouridine(55) synthase TruB [Oscillospiraceae bacterium]|nr:tRNA pseudouridine(55) synthase TruB [Oscillospiraceae bacterium]
MANGMLVIDKPEGWTSHDVVAKCRRLLAERRIGHAGTLDPMATGVLPIFVGRATRAVEFAAAEGKEYLAGLRLGLTTDTQDTTGQVLTQTEADVTRETLEGALAAFRGDIMQVPPMYSALKRDGRKLYELARAGKAVERTARPVTISALEIVAQTAPDTYTLRVACSKGTYVRTLCHDIGQALGCGGVMCMLRRTKAAGFTLEQAVALPALEKLAAQGEAQNLLLPVDTYFGRHPAVTVGGQALKQARNGAAFSCAVPDGLWRVYGDDGEFLLLGKCTGGSMTTIKSFFEV